MRQGIIIESLAMDLLRVALGLHRGSFAMAERFKKEAINRQKELEQQKTGTYLKKLLKKTMETLEKAEKNNAEDLLMYSILFQNFAQKNYS